MKIAKGVLTKLTKLPSHKLRQRITKTIETLDREPIPEGASPIKGDYFPDNTYSIREGGYRIVYAVDISTNEVHILKIEHRKKVYDKSG